MNYAAMAQAIRDERVDVLHLYAKAGYPPAMAKIAYMAMGLDIKLKYIVEMYDDGELLDQTANGTAK